MKKKRSAVIYIIAALWILSMFGFPLFSFLRVMIMIGISAAVIAFAFKKIKEIGETSGSSRYSADRRSAGSGQANDTRVGTGTANPYSSTYRYSMNNTQNVQDAVVRPADTGTAEPEIEVQLSRREKRKLAKQAAMEAELKKARDAETAKIEAEKKAEEEKKNREELKKQQEQSLADKYNVPRRKRTGDAAIDKMLDDEEKAIAEMRRLDDAIEDEKVSSQIVHLEDVTAKIVDYVVEHPDKKSQVRRFFNYYLPTSIKLLNSYDRMDEAGISGTNIDGTKGQVEDMMDKALEAFDKQLDALYGDEAMDVSSEIKVMQNLLSQESTEDEITAALK